MEPFLHGARSFAHGYTFGGHPVSTAVALANLDIFERESSTSTCSTTRTRSAPRSRSSTTCRSSATSAATGYFYGIELVKDKAPRRRSRRGVASAAARLPVQGAVRRGLYCRADDRGDPVVQLSPR
jgi:adenosylmethionine-8-amino-7-oxononanoate aminotransferase